MAKCEAEGCNKEAANRLTIERYTGKSTVQHVELSLCAEHFEAELKSLLKDRDYFAVVVEKVQP